MENTRTYTVITKNATGPTTYKFTDEKDALALIEKAIENGINVEIPAS
jgi:hypothetical protein